jgi:hypothetical protein
MANIDYSKDDFIDVNNQLFRKARNKLSENAEPIKNMDFVGKENAKNNLQIYGSELINNLNQINYTLEQIETYLFVPSKVVKTKGNQIVVSDGGNEGGEGKTETVSIGPTTPLSVIKEPTEPIDTTIISDELDEDVDVIPTLSQPSFQRINKDLSYDLKELGDIISSYENELMRRDELGLRGEEYFNIDNDLEYFYQEREKERQKLDEGRRKGIEEGDRLIAEAEELLKSKQLNAAQEKQARSYLSGLYSKVAKEAGEEELRQKKYNERVAQLQLASQTPLPKEPKQPKGFPRLPLPSGLLLNEMVKNDTQVGKLKLLNDSGFDTNSITFNGKPLKSNNSFQLTEFIKAYEASINPTGSGRRYRGGVVKAPTKSKEQAFENIRQLIENPKFKVGDIKKELSDAGFKGVGKIPRDKEAILAFIDANETPLVKVETPAEFEPLDEGPKDEAVASLDISKKLDKVLVKLSNMGQNTPVPSYLSKVSELITSLIQFIGRTTVLYITKIKKNLNYLDEEQVKLIFNSIQQMNSKVSMLKSYSDMSGALIKSTLYKQLEKELSGLYNEINNSIRNYSNLKDFTMFSKVGSGRSFGVDFVGGFIQSPNDFINRTSTTRFL